MNESESCSDKHKTGHVKVLSRIRNLTQKQEKEQYVVRLAREVI